MRDEQPVHYPPDPDPCTLAEWEAGEARQRELYHQNLIGAPGALADAAAYDATVAEIAADPALAAVIACLPPDCDLADPLYVGMVNAMYDIAGGQAMSYRLGSAVPDAITQVRG